MLEQGFTFLLKKFLGEFVEDGSILQENLQVAVWSGCIVLEQLVLKKELLSLLSAPLSLSYGSIGRIEIQIPWASLGVDPVIISIDKICLLLEPKYEWNPDARENKEQALKQAKLAALELFAKRRLQPVEDPWKGYKDLASKWLLESVISRIVDKIQVTISDIHIRYEDHVSCPSSFAVGLTLERILANSRNQHQDEGESESDSDFPRETLDTPFMTQKTGNNSQDSSLMKVIEIRQLSVYWNPLVHSGIAATTSTFTGRGRHEIDTLMLRTLARGSQFKDRPKHHYILLPTDIAITVGASIDHVNKTTSSHVQVTIADIGISFEDRQFREAISLGTNMSNFMQLERFSGYRPSVSVHEDPTAWWKYAVRAVMFQMHAERRSLNWTQISDRSLDKDVYIELWKSKLCTPSGVLNVALAAAAKSAAAATTATAASKSSLSSQEAVTEDRSASSASAAAPIPPHPAPSAAAATGPAAGGFAGKNLSADKLAYRDEALFSELLAESRARRKLLRENKISGKSRTRPPAIPSLNSETASLLMVIERRLTFEDIVFFRSLAEKELSESDAAVNRQGWLDGTLSWATGGLFGSVTTDDERGTFFEALVRDPENLLSTANLSSSSAAASAATSDPNTVVTVASVTLVKGSITLALSTPAPVNPLASSSVTALSLPFLEIGLAGFRADASVFGDGTRVKAYVSLQDVEMFEIFSDEVNGLQKNRLLSRRVAASATAAGGGGAGGSKRGSLSANTGSLTGAKMGSKDKRIATPPVNLGLAPSYHSFQEKSGFGGVFGGSATVKVDSLARPLFSVSIEMLPSTCEHDVICSVVMEELEVLVSPAAKWVDSLVTFTTWPEDLEFWSEMEMTAMNQLADFKSKIDAKIEYMMSNQKKVLIEARINAPVVIISSAGASDMIVMDLGQITVVTERLAKLEHEKSMAEQSMLTTESRDVPPTNTDTHSAAGNVTLSPPSERSLSPISELDSRDENESGSGVGGSGDAEEEGNYKQCLDAGPESLTGALSDLEEVRSRYERRQSTSYINLPSSLSLHSGGSDHAAQGHNPQSCNQSITSDYGGADDKFFDMFKVQVSHIEVFMIRAEDWTGHVEAEAVETDTERGGGSSRSGRTSSPEKLAIVDRFNVNMSILLSVLSWDTSLPMMKIEVNLPEVNVRLSEDRLVRLALFGASVAASSKAIVTAGREKAKKYETAKKQRAGSFVRSSSQGNINSFWSPAAGAGLLGKSTPATRSARSSINSLPLSSDFVGGALEGAMPNFHQEDDDSDDDDDDEGFFDALSDFGDAGQSPRPPSSIRAGSIRGIMSSPRSMRSGKTRSRSGSVVATPRGFLSSIPGVGSSSRSHTSMRRYSGRSTPATRSVLEEGDGEVSDADSIDSDNSFHSVEGDGMPSAFDAARRVEELQFSIRQREAVRNKIMGEIRSLESDTAKRSRAMLSSLQEELSDCESELHMLKISYVEALMIADESKLNRIRENPGEFGSTTAGIDNITDYLDALIGNSASDFETDLNQRRTFMRTTVFKTKPKRTKLGGARGGVGGNKELVFIELKVAQVGIMFIRSNLTSSPSYSSRAVGVGLGTTTGTNRESASPTPGSPPEEDQEALEIGQDSEVMIHTILSGLGVKIKHRALDSQITLSISDLEVKDAIAGRVAADALGLSPGAPMCVISSELPPELSSGGSLRTHNFTQLLRVKYAIVYGEDNRDEDRGDGEDDEQPLCLCTPAKHDLSVKAGYLGIAVEPETVAAILRTANSIVAAIKPTLKVISSNGAAAEEDADKDNDKDNPPRVASSMPSEADRSQPMKPLALPLIMLRFHCQGGSIALLHRARPLVSASAWDLQANMEGRETWLKFWLRLVDASIDHHIDLPISDAKQIYGNSNRGAFATLGSTLASVPYTFLSPMKGANENSSSSRDIRHMAVIYPSQFPSSRQIVAGRQITTGQGQDPSVYISFQIEVVDRRPVVRGGVNIAPQQLVVVPSFLSTLVGSLMEGALVKESVTLTKTLEEPLEQQGGGRPQHSESGGGPLRSPLEALTTVFKTTRVGGNFDVKVNDLLISLPTEYAPSQSLSPSPRQQSSERLLHRQSLVLAVQEGITANLVFGEECAFGGIELVSVIARVNARISDMRVVDPFDISTRVSIFLPGSLLKDGDQVKRLEIDRPFGPKSLFDDHADNQISLSVGVSPVVVHINERITYEAGAWAAANEIQFNSIANYFAAARIPTKQEIQRPLSRSQDHGDHDGGFQLVSVGNEIHKLPNLGLSIVASVRVYELGALVETSSSPSATKNRFVYENSNIGEASRTQGQGQGQVPSASISVTNPIFYFSTRNIAADVVVGPEHTGVDSSTFSTSATGGHNAEIPLSTTSSLRSERFAVATLSVQSVDIDYLPITGGGTGGSPAQQLRRLLATVNRPTAAAAAASMHTSGNADPLGVGGGEDRSVSGLLPPLLSMDSFVYECNAAVEPDSSNENSISPSPALSCRVCVTDTHHVTVNADIAHMQLVVISSAIVNLANMAVALQGSLLDGLAAVRRQQESSSRPSIPSAQSAKTGERPPSVDTSGSVYVSESSSDNTPRNTTDAGAIAAGVSEGDHPTPRAQPLSVPLSSIGSGAVPQSPTDSASTGKQPIKPLPSINLTKYSFGLPQPLCGLSLSVSVRSCGIWIPSDESSIAAVALHTSLSADGQASFHNIQWSRLEAAANPTMPFFSHSSFGSGHERQATDDESTLREGFLAAKFGVSDVHMYLSPVKYSEIYTPLVPVSPPSSSSASSHIPADIRNRSASGMNGFAFSIGTAPTIPRTQKQLLLPFAAQIVYGASVTTAHSNKDHGNGDSPGRAAGGTGARARASIPSLSIDQRVELHCQEIEILAPLDYRPFLKIQKNTIQPIIDLGNSLKQLQTRSPKSRSSAFAAGVAAGRSSSVNQTTTAAAATAATAASSSGNGDGIPAEEVCAVTPSHVFELLPVLPDAGSLTVELHQEGIVIFFVNDLYNQPVTVARATVSSVSALVVVDAPLRHSSTLPSLVGLQLHEAINTARVRAEMRVTIGVEYHNQTILVWEPLIEPFEVCGTFSLPHAALTGDTVGGPLIWYISTATHPPSPAPLQRGAAVPSGRTTSGAGSAQEASLLEGKKQCQSLIRHESSTDVAIRDVVAAVTEAFDTVSNTVSTAIATVASSAPGQQQAVISNTANADDSLASAVVAPPIAAEIRIQKPINVNFTMGLLQTISSIANSAQVLNKSFGSGDSETDLLHRDSQADTEGREAGDEGKSKDLSVMVIRNDSGLMLQYYWHGDASRAVDVAPNSERGLSLADMEVIQSLPSGKSPSERSQPASRAPRGAHSVSIALWHPSDNYSLSPLRDVPLDGSGCRIFLLDVSDRSESYPALAARPELRQTQSEAVPRVNPGEVHPLRLAKQLSGVEVSQNRSSRSALEVLDSTPRNTMISTADDTRDSSETSGKLPKQQQQPQLPPHLVPKGVCVAAELSSKGGVRTLTIRSTIKIVNSSVAPVRAQLLSLGAAQPVVLWEEIIPQGSSLPLPAHLCNIPNTRVTFQPLLESSKKAASHVIWPGSWAATATTAARPIDPVELVIPIIPGAISASGAIIHGEVDIGEEEYSEDEFEFERSKVGNASAHGRGNEGGGGGGGGGGESQSQTKTKAAMDAMRRSVSNRVRRRKVLVQRRDGVESIAYSHWLELSSSSSATTTVAATATASPSNSNSHSHSIPSSPSFSELRNSPSAHTDVFFNVDVASMGAPRTQTRSTKDSCMSRVFTLCCPVTTVNLLACDIDILIVGEKKKRGFSYGASAPFVLTPSKARDLAYALTHEDVQYDPPAIGSPLSNSCLVSLKSGESTGLMAFHATDKLSVAIRLNSTRTHEKHFWSTVVSIAGCGAQSTGESSRTFDVKFANGSVLEVLMDLSENNGVRTMKFFVPYWIVSSSVLTLQFQHDPALANAYAEHCADDNLPVKDINGVDGLAADQFYVQKRSPERALSAVLNWFSSGNTDTNSTDSERGKARGESDRRHESLRKARGVDGVVLGPQSPVRGLADILAPPPADGMFSAGRRLTWGHLDYPGPKSSDNSNRHRSSGDAVRNSSSASQESVTSSIPFRLVQCSHSSGDASGRVRMRATGTKWSTVFSLDSVNAVAALDVKSIKGYCEGAEAEEPSASSSSSSSAALRSEPLPPPRVGRQIFSFGVLTMRAEPPFTKTKVVVVVDRFLLINGLGRSIDVRQVGAEEGDSITLTPKNKQPMWWRPGEQSIQIRLSQGASAWSGRLQIRSDGETTVRLRSEGDREKDREETVFFISVAIARQGPRVCIVFKSAEGFIPYRIENLTLHTFNLRQQISSAIRGGYSAPTPILPYHVCPYAWDEPTASRSVSLDEVESKIPTSARGNSPTRKGAGAEVEETRIGVFSLDKVGSYTTKNNLVMKVLTDGPVRVLQILDRRSTASASASTSPLSIGADDPMDERSSMKPAKLHFMLDVRSFGVSFIDQVPQELMFFSVTGVSINHMIFAGEEDSSSTSLTVDRVQLDNQLWSTPYPCLFYALKPVPSTADTDTDGGDPSNQRPFIELELNRNRSYTGVEYLSLLRFSVLPFDVNVEGTIVKRMIHMGYAAADLFAPLSKTDTDPHPDPSVRKCAPRNTAAASQKIPGISLATASSSSSTINVLDDKGRQTSIPPPPVLGSKARDEEVIDAEADANTNSPTARIIQTALARTIPAANITESLAKVYIESMQISELRVNLSFNPLVLPGTAASSETFADFESDSGLGSFGQAYPGTSSSLIVGALTTLLKAIGSTLAKIDNCPLRFQSYSMNHAFLNAKDLALMMGSHYGTQFVGQTYLILGSSDAFGNPVKFFTTLGEGVWDFLYLPVVGLMTSPAAFGEGVLRGSSSLVRRTIASFCNTASTVAGSMQVGLVTLGIVESPYLLLARAKAAAEEANYRLLVSSEDTPDEGKESADALVTASDAVKFRRPAGFRDGLKVGFIGAFSEPLAALRTDTNSVRALLVGSAKGALGLFARPIFGLLGSWARKLDYVSYALLPRIEGTEKHLMKRSRAPRFFHSPNVPLLVYKAEENAGLELLARINMGRYKSEGYEWHCRLRGNIIAVMTPVRLLVVSDSFDFCELHWQCLLSQILFLEIDLDRNAAASASAARAASLVSDSSAAPRGLGLETGRREGVLTAAADRHTVTEKEMSLSWKQEQQHGDSEGGGEEGNREVTGRGRQTQTQRGQSLPTEDDLRRRLRALPGAPVLHVYHLPTNLQPQRATETTAIPRSGIDSTAAGASTAGATGVNTTTVPLVQLSSGSGSAANSESARLSHRQLSVVNHEQLVEFLGHLLVRVPSLASDEVLRYLTYCGVPLPTARPASSLNMPIPRNQQQDNSPSTSSASESTSTPSQSLPASAAVFAGNIDYQRGVISLHKAGSTPP